MEINKIGIALPFFSVLLEILVDLRVSEDDD